MNQIQYHLIHTRLGKDTGMPTLTDLHSLIDRYAAALPKLDLDGEQQEEYSTMLLWLQNTVETGEPNGKIVGQCLSYFKRFEALAA
jgi:hypothetical protein